jgi:hypothetical protein
MRRMGWGGVAIRAFSGRLSRRLPTLWQARVLLLSYQNILKIDNLVGFDKLVKLQLDNNIIEKIENLGHLSNLEVWAGQVALQP